MRRAYDVKGGDREHRLGDGGLSLVAAALVLGVWQGMQAAAVVLVLVVAGVVVVVGVGVGVPRRRHQSSLVPLLCCAAVMVGAWAGERAWANAVPRHLGDYTGWAPLVADPAPFGQGLRVTVEIEGERFDTWVYGGAQRKMADRGTGEYVWVDGRRVALGGNARRARIRHVVGRFDAEVLGDVVDGSALSTANNRVRRNLRSAAEATMSDDDASLFTGLVIGDDARQPAWMLDDFRASGLSHLTAVSGQNVAFVLAAALPLLRRLRPWWRWAATVGLVIWFMALTRFEPSVLRAGVMAMLAATAFMRGQQVRPLRLLALAVVMVVIADPLLVWSVGFWLSVCATGGVCVVGPWLQPRLPGPQWLRLPLAVTLGAQVGVALPSVLVFGRLPIMSLPANLAAVPVAGFVMLYGLPAGLLASLLPSALRSLVMVPAVVGTRWVASVAQVAAAVEPSPMWTAMWWSVAVSGLAGWWWRSRSRVSAVDVPI